MGGEGNSSLDISYSIVTFYRHNFYRQLHPMFFLLSLMQKNRNIR